MKIEQALYGEARGGHALLAESGDLRTATELTSRLDLPDTAPPGVEWSPFFSGFSYGDEYVFAMTTLDAAAPRAGMVLSHALIAPLDKIVAVRNLRPLLALFRLALDRSSRIDAAEIELDEGSPSPQAADLAGAADALSIRGQGPVVRLGHIGFDRKAPAMDEIGRADQFRSWR